MSTTPLPPEFKFGHVAGRFALAVADTTADEDSLPELRGMTGAISFTPRTEQVVSVSEEPTLIVKTTMRFGVDSAGRLSDAHGNPTVVLPVGVHTVSYDLKETKRSSHQIEVTEEHTAQAPYQLVLDQPYVPPAGVIVQTLPVPAGRQPGQVLGTAEDGSLVWVEQAGGGGGPQGPSHESILASGNVTLPVEHPVLTIRADDPATLAAPEAPDGTVVTIHVAHGWEHLTWDPGITVTGDSATTETWVVLVRAEGAWKALVSGESGGGSGILTGNGNPNTLGIKAATVGVLYADEAGTDGAALWSANFVDHWDGTTTWVVVNGYADKWTAAGGVELAFNRYGSRLVVYVIVELTGGGNGEEVTLPASTIDVGEVDEGFRGSPLAGTLVLTTLPDGMGLPSPVQLPPIVCVFTQHGRYVLHMPEVVIPAYTSPDPVAVMGSLELVAEEAPWPVGSGGGGGGIGI